MEDQYLQLLFNAHVIRLIPADVPAVSAGVVLWEFDKAMPVAYNDTDLVRVFVQDLGAIARTRLLFNQLENVALDAEQSRSRLAEYAGRPREELDDSGPHLA